VRIVPIVLPTPYPVGPVNAYLLPGPPVTLVDCGPKTDEAREVLEDGLTRAGCRLSDIERLVLTHGHTDHFGLAAVVAAGGARVFAHPDEMPKLTGDRSFVEPVRTLIVEAGFPASVADALFAEFRAYRGHLDRTVPTDLVRDGDRLPLADGDLEVLHTPGHAQGHVCLWDGETLISGDLLLEEISPNPLMEFDPDGHRLRTLPAYLRSLRRVAALGARTAYPGHGEPLGDPAGRAAEILRHHEERKEALARLLDTRAWTLRELADAWFPGLPIRSLYLGLSEVIGHLDLLIEEGRIVAERQGEIVSYRILAGSSPG
jgi:glyoxylase-like metal-dependent hydrolase (beta-lactamase superfamily II)